MTDERPTTDTGDANAGQDAPATDPQSRPGFPGTPGATGEDLVKPVWPVDAGAYIGHEPERATETIPGGVQRDDDRIAATQSQGTGVGRPDERGQPVDEPSGHREASPADAGDTRATGDAP
jgi:hypothetical protein